MTLIDRCRNYLSELGVTKAAFCRRVDISTTALYRWWKGNLELSEKTKNRIEKIIEKAGY